MSAKSIQVEDGLSGSRNVAEVTASRELREADIILTEVT